MKLTDALRAVTVERGEALLEVAKVAGRPFVVTVSGAKVVATGTAFLVRSTPPPKMAGDAFGVTLIEGQVIVERSGGAVQSALNSTVVMTPGARLRVRQANGDQRRASPTEARLDRPVLDPLLAWKRGVVELDNVILADAVADMNRYSTVPIRVADSEAIKALRISGVYRTGDNEGFAQAVAKLHGLVVRPRDGGVELVGK